MNTDPTRESAQRGEPVLGNSERPILVIVCDTEEEFDWSKPFDRASTSVTAMSQIHQLQRIAEDFDLKPTYVIDFPVASQPEGFEPLLRVMESNRCEIGAHVHPWVNPPFEEEMTRFNSFAGNLDPRLERSKLVELTAVIQEYLDLRPEVYKAGRYGIGENTDEILETEGYQVDLSPMPPFDFSDEGGPDFTNHSLAPSFPRSEDGLLRIPQTGAYAGLARSQGQWLYPLVSGTLLTSLHVPGILSRLRLVDRLVLSPEGYTSNEMKRLTRVLLEDGVRLFCFTLHSPSLQPGCTPYVRDSIDLSSFLETCRSYFEFFVSEVGGVGMTASEVKPHLLDSDTHERNA